MSKIKILATDQLQTPLSLLGAGGQFHSAYTPYGYRPAQSPYPLLGFTGQLRERELGWYLLGNGYRAYNPVLMRFHSPDRLSPFGLGWINSYAYCGGDPVNFHDRSGKTLMSMLTSVWQALVGFKANFFGSAAPAIGNISSAIGSYYNPDTQNPLITVTGLTETAASIVATGSFFAGYDPLMNTANTIAGGISMYNSGRGLFTDISQPQRSAGTIPRETIIDMDTPPLTPTPEGQSLSRAYSRQDSALNSVEARMLVNELNDTRQERDAWQQRALFAEQEIISTMAWVREQ